MAFVGGSHSWRKHDHLVGHGKSMGKILAARRKLLSSRESAHTADRCSGTRSPPACHSAGRITSVFFPHTEADDVIYPRPALGRDVPKSPFTPTGSASAHRRGVALQMTGDLLSPALISKRRRAIYELVLSFEMEIHRQLRAAARAGSDPRGLRP